MVYVLLLFFIQTETIRHKDNSNMTAACSLQMLSEETYCLSDIIKELDTPSLHKKRKHDENYLLSIKKNRSNTTISNVSMETDDVSLVTQNVSMATNTVSMVPRSIPVSTNSVSLSTQYVSVATNTDSMTQEHHEQEDDSVVLEDDSSAAVSPVSISTHDVPAVVMIGAETQCVSISTDGDGLEIVDEITSPTPKNSINDYPFTTDNMESNDSNQKDSNTDSMEPSNNSTEGEHNSTDYYHETNFSVGLIEKANDSNDELNSEHSEVHVEETQKQSSKKESIEDKPKRGRGRPRKRRYFPAPVSEDLNDSVKGDTQVETLTNSGPGSVLLQAHAERPNSLALSSNYEVHSGEQTEYVATKSTTLSESENIDKPKPKRGRGRPRKRTGFPLQFIRKLAPPVSLPATENLNSTANVDNEIQVENSTRSDSENLTIYTQAECPNSPEVLDIPSSILEGHVDKGEPVKYTTTSSSSTLESEIVEVVGEAGAAKFYLSSDNQDVSSANLGSSGTNTTSSQPVLNEPSDSSSVLLTVSDSKPTSTVKRPRGRPRKVLLPDDLPTMVSLPTFESQAASPLSSVVQPSKSVDNTVTAESATTIKFVSDTSLHVRSGTMFFYPQNSKKTTPTKQTNIKNLESIADSLKDISGKTVRGDSSVQAVAWLINVLSELDVKKDSSKTVNKGDNQVNGGIKDVCPVKPSSSHAPPLLPKPSPCSSSAAESTICSANERIHHSADVQSTQPVKIGQPAAVTTVQPQCAQHALAEVHASYIDVSWRIVTSSNGKNSTSLKSFYKLVPVRVEQDIQVENGACSFLGVPVYSNTQVISKLLNTSVPEEDNGVFGFEHRPNVTRRVASGLKQPAVTLSFEWVDDAVSIVPIYDTSKHLSNEGNPLRIDSVGLQLPKPLKLPKEGCKVYLGDFQVVSNDVKFVVYHTVTVSKTPRPYLSIPAEALAKSSSATQTTRCRVVGIARNDVHISKGIPVEKPAKPAGKRLSRRCHFCGADLATLRDIRYHRKIHPAPLGVKCSECPRRFLTVNRLSVHIVKHTCQVQYKCEVCSKQFIPPNLPVEKECIKHHLKLCQTCRAKRKCSKCGVKRRKITVAQQTRSRIKVH